MNEKAKLYLGNIPKEISNEFSNYAKQHETKQSQLFIEIWNNFKKHYLAFDEQEQALIEQALSIVDKSFDEFVKKTVKTYAILFSKYGKDGDLSCCCI
jgi:hypothetical protein